MVEIVANCLFSSQGTFKTLVAIHPLISLPVLTDSLLYGTLQNADL